MALSYISFALIIVTTVSLILELRRQVTSHRRIVGCSRPHISLPSAEESMPVFSYTPEGCGVVELSALKMTWIFDMLWLHRVRSTFKSQRKIHVWQFELRCWTLQAGTRRSVRNHRSRGPLGRLESVRLNKRYERLLNAGLESLHGWRKRLLRNNLLHCGVCCLPLDGWFLKNWLVIMLLLYDVLNEQMQVPPLIIYAIVSIENLFAWCHVSCASEALRFLLAHSATGQELGLQPVRLPVQDKHGQSGKTDETPQH